MKNKQILVTGGAGYIGSHVENLATAPVAVAERVREVLGWTPKFDDLDTIVRTSLEWERKIASQDPTAYWAA